jgi:poly(hydroxyalkanoate) depolymerase family esterase
MPAIRPGLRLRRSGKGFSAFAPKKALKDRLSDLPPIKDNPGNLRGRCYVSKGLKAPAPLVVVLHGCTQDAAVYDQGSGWSKLADRHGFALLFPEQQRANNPMLCFNWFSPEDTTRDRGEAASIRAMVDAMAAAYPIDGNRIFVTGLSAGGAMASVMLATYPELFAAGAILAGLPYGTADGVGEAFDRMGGRGQGGAAELAAKVRAASPHRGPWPRVQVWQGSADHTVVASNADAITRQWAALHGLNGEPNWTEQAAGHTRRDWLDAAGAPVIEQYLIAGMAHGVPLESGGADPIGAAGAHMLDVGLSSTARIAEFFGIAAASTADRQVAAPVPARAKAAPRPAQARAPAPPRQRAPAASAGGVQGIIENALRAAGLMK